MIIKRLLRKKRKAVILREFFNIARLKKDLTLRELKSLKRNLMIYLETERRFN